MLPLAGAIAAVYAGVAVARPLNIGKRILVKLTGKLLNRSIKKVITLGEFGTTLQQQLLPEALHQVWPKSRQVQTSSRRGKHNLLGGGNKQRSVT